MLLYRQSILCVWCTQYKCWYAFLQGKFHDQCFYNVPYLIVIVGVVFATWIYTDCMEHFHWAWAMLNNQWSSDVHFSYCTFDLLLSVFNVCIVMIFKHEYQLPPTLNYTFLIPKQCLCVQHIAWSWIKKIITCKYTQFTFPICKQCYLESYPIVMHGYCCTWWRIMAIWKKQMTPRF